MIDRELLIATMKITVKTRALEVMVKPNILRNTINRMVKPNIMMRLLVFLKNYIRKYLGVMTTRFPILMFMLISRCL